MHKSEELGRQLGFFFSSGSDVATGKHKNPQETPKQAQEGTKNKKQYITLPNTKTSQKQAKTRPRACVYNTRIKAGATDETGERFKAILPCGVVRRKKRFLRLSALSALLGEMHKRKAEKPLVIYI